MTFEQKVKKVTGVSMQEIPETPEVIREKPALTGSWTWTHFSGRHLVYETIEIWNTPSGWVKRSTTHYAQ